jgi:hypothetical protein
MSRRDLHGMSLEGLMAIDAAESAARSRADSFAWGKPEKILGHWECKDPDDEELREIVKNILRRMQQ